MALSKLAKKIDDLDDPICDLCEKPVVTEVDTFMIDGWLLHYDCYYIIIEKRLTPLRNILLSSQNRFDEWLDGALHLAANQE